MMQDFDNINNNEETGGSLADSSSAAEILKKRGKLAQSEKDKISDIDGMPSDECYYRDECKINQSHTESDKEDTEEMEEDYTSSDKEILDDSYDDISDDMDDAIIVDEGDLTDDEASDNDDELELVYENPFDDARQSIDGSSLPTNPIKIEPLSLKNILPEGSRRIKSLSLDENGITDNNSTFSPVRN